MRSENLNSCVRVLVLGQTEDRGFLKIQFCIYFFSLVEQNLLR